MIVHGPEGDDRLTDLRNADGAVQPSRLDWFRAVKWVLVAVLAMLLLRLFVS